MPAELEIFLAFSQILIPIGFVTWGISSYITEAGFEATIITFYIPQIQMWMTIIMGLGIASSTLQITDRFLWILISFTIILSGVIVSFVSMRLARWLMLRNRERFHRRAG